MQELLTLAQPRVRRTLVYLDLGGMATVKAQPQTGDAADLADPRLPRMPPRRSGKYRFYGHSYTAEYVTRAPVQTALLVVVRFVFLLTLIRDTDSIA